MGFRAFVALAALLGFASVAGAQSPPHTNVHDMFKVGATWNGALLVDVQECHDPATTGWGTRQCSTVIHAQEPFELPDPVVLPCPDRTIAQREGILRRNPFGQNLVAKMVCGYNILDWPVNVGLAYAQAFREQAGVWPPSAPVTVNAYEAPDGAGCRAPYAHLCNPPTFNWSDFFRRFGR